MLSGLAARLEITLGSAALALPPDSSLTSGGSSAASEILTLILRISIFGEAAAAESPTRSLVFIPRSPAPSLICPSMCTCITSSMFSVEVVPLGLVGGRWGGGVIAWKTGWRRRENNRQSTSTILSLKKRYQAR